MRCGWIFVLVWAGCGFEAPSNGRMLDASLIDSPIDGSGTATCPWPFVTEYATPCPTAMIGTGLDLMTAGTYTYDTGTEVVTAPGGSTIAVTTTVANGVRTIWTARFRVATGVTLRVVGPMPLAVISADTIRVEGVIDVGSHVAGADSGDGAGSNPTVCPLTPPIAGEQCLQHGGSGGGGGGFSGAGGRGGDGGGGRGAPCGSLGLTYSTGGIGGVALSPIPAMLRGGCGGRIGGNNTDAGSLGGPPGSGGGAILMVARSTVSVPGVIRAGGAGGGGGILKRAGGGGGGSGGMIVLEGTSIMIDGALAANGAGGGGGCEDANGAPGEDGRGDDQVADGGANQGAGTDGGNGGAGATRAGTAATTADRGGGGGGGGTGFIRLHAATISTPGKVSPPSS